MFSKVGLRAKMLLSICGVVFISYAVSISYITYNASKMAQSEAQEKAFEIASNHGKEIEARLNHAMGVARDVASTFEGMKISGETPSRVQINAILKNTLKQNPDFIAIDTCWEPNALDGRDADSIDASFTDIAGRFAPYWNRGSGSIAVEPLTGFDNESWYAVPRDTGKDVITEPYLFPVGDRDVLMSTVVAPIRVKGKFLGMVAVDISLETFGEMMAGIRPFESGYGFLVSHAGYMVSHPVKERVGKNVERLIEGKYRQPFMAALKSGRSYSMVSESKKGEEAIYQIMVPIRVGKTETPWSIGVVAPMEKIMAGAVTLRNTSIIIGLIGFFVLMAVVWFLSVTLVVRPINQAVEGLKDIAEGDGDLTLRLPVNTCDEIGELSTWFNTFIEKLQHIIGDLATEAGGIDGASHNLLDVAGNLSTRADNTSERSSSVSGAAEQMAANINSVAVSMEQASANTDMVATAAEEMTSTIGEVARQSETARNISEDAVRRAGGASQKMSRLGEVATAIGSVTEAISEISEQTNLLALNATIEAARAGEAGKGFAVVANEIKALANQTADATRDIKERVDGIQSVTKETVVDIEEVTRVIGEVNDIVSTIATAVEEQSVATREIATNIAQASQGIQEVSSMVTQSTGAIGEITQEITQVNANAGEISENSSQVHGSAEELSSMAQNLREVVGGFKI
ncbi:MAG: methyl-accepting chemotaxis protein [Desulfobacterales bacterium]|nr:methyl-accepting chemotaxis protein [Desulfobacterales bacterium]